MYYRKVWIIILIIVVVSSLFPSILVYADDGDGGGGAGGIPVEGEDNEFPPDGIPDIEYSFQDAPFPGNYNKITEANWQDFINRAEELGHKEIRKFTGNYFRLEDGRVEFYPTTGQVFYSTAGDDLEHVYDLGSVNIDYRLIYKNLEETNVLDTWNGHLTGNDESDCIWWGSMAIWYFDWDIYIQSYDSHESFLYYSAVIDNDPYQNKPPRYNIDPSRGWGMSFIKPAYGDWINIPRKLGMYRDEIEIEIQMPQLYEVNGVTRQIFDVTDGIGQMAVPNFAIKLYAHNAGRIEGSQVVGRDGIWILPYQIKFVEGYMDGTYMHGARFIASVPIEHKPSSLEHSLIVADLVLHQVGGHENYTIEIPEARTWTKYLIYYGVVDEDGDGYDDRTGLPIDDGRKPDNIIKDGKPNKDDYPDDILGTIAYYFDTFIWYIKQPFVFIADLIGNIINWISTTIDSWIDSFTSIFTTLFSFLPAEIVLMLALGFATMMIITIIRAIRGS